MVANATQTVNIIRNLRHPQFFHPSMEKSRVVAIYHLRDSNHKAYYCERNIGCTAARTSGLRNVVEKGLRLSVPQPRFHVETVHGLSGPI